MHKKNTDQRTLPHCVRLRASGEYYEAGLRCKTLIMALAGLSDPSSYVGQTAKIRALAKLPNGPEIIGDVSLVRPVHENALWKVIVDETSCVAACLPIYTAKKRNYRIDDAELLDIAIEQMEEGVGVLTIHPTPSPTINGLSHKRLVPCTSRGGRMVIEDAVNRGWREDNVYIRILPDLLRHAKKNATVFSIGATYRSANIFDSCDPTQWAEIERQIELARYITGEGVGAIIESPGHARPRDIKRLSQVLRPAGFPVMPLGPIPTDIAIGMDHVSGALGATLLGLEGSAYVPALLSCHFEYA